ncbi:uncharacterized protein LOC133178151 [Saccostrea echinata]|uniref:uncharacterized protein LOC133178151 n=1 Tax=Saccostrea echinata TaxID=191078 RepID=UPI002A7F2990|nr:uncharacterized protein LOC133178151 [Saccostrea echinata]
MHALRACNKITEFSEVVDGFVDTLKLFKLVKPGLPSYRQENLCECLSDIVYSAHNAVDDVAALKSLVQSYFTPSVLNSTDVRRSSITVQSVIASYFYSCQIRTNLPSLQSLVAGKISSQGIARKIAGSGLLYNHLQMAFNADTVNGISKLCQEKTGNSVRVTKSQKIINSLNNYFAQCNES